MQISITKKDIQALRRVLRHVATSNVDIQHEVLRLDALLERISNTPKEKHHA